MDNDQQPTSEIGRRIYEARLREGLTQDQFGRRYDVSGPAIFKFEKGKVNPSLPLWKKIAADTDLTERHAVLLWAREKLPEENRHYLDVPTLLREGEAEYGEGKAINYSITKDRKKLRKLAARDKHLPQGLRDLLEDDDIWALFKPSGHEIEELKRRFSSLGFGSKEDYREALRLVRQFGRV